MALMRVEPAMGVKEQFSRREWVLLGLLLLIVTLWALGSAPLFDVDEGAFSEATREMLHSGDWLHTTLNGEPRFDKPIGVYWFQAVSVSLLGVNEFAFRLTSALSAWLWAMALVHFSLPRLGRKTAAGAGVILATCLGAMAIGRAATADALLNLLLTLTALDAWRWLSESKRGALRRAYAWMGAGLLVKGPVAVVVPGAALVLWLACSLPWREALRRLGRTVADGWGWLLLLVISVPWYVYAIHRDGQAFIDGFFVRHNLARYSSPLEHHSGSLLYYVVVLPLLLLPWTPLLASVLLRVRDHWRDPMQRFMLIWCGFVLVFFSLSGTKLPHYVLYGSSPVVILMAMALAKDSGKQRVALTVSFLLLLALLGGSVLTVPLWSAKVGSPLYSALLTGLTVSPWITWVFGLGAFAVLFLMTQLNHRPGMTLLWRAGASSVVVAAVALNVVMPWWGDVLQGPIKRAAYVARQRQEPAVQWALHQPSFSVYREQETPRRAPHDGELALVRVDELPRLIAKVGGRFTMLYSERGYGLILWHASAGASDPQVAQRSAHG
jgi:4-amino-4-deoxy-L-arabinose transferase-like glycosyltransferase